MEISRENILAFLVKNAEFFKTLVSVTLGFLLSLLSDQLKTYYKNKATLNALLVLTYAKVRSMIEVLDMYISTQSKLKDDKYILPKFINIYSFPQLGLTAEQTERLFALSKSEKLSMFVTSMDTFNDIYAATSSKFEYYELDSYKTVEMIAECEQCLINIEAIFIKNQSWFSCLSRLLLGTKTALHNHVIQYNSSKNSKMRCYVIDTDSTSPPQQCTQSNDKQEQ